MYGSWVLILIILISSLPVIAVYIWFRVAKYQFSLVRFLFALLIGAAAFFPALILQDLLYFSFSARSRMEIFYHVFVRIAFTEELSRLLMLFVFFWISGLVKQDGSLGQPFASNIIKRGAAIGLVAGIGFAFFENAVYAASDANVLLLRVITTAPLHAACGSRVGTAAVLFPNNPIKAFFRLLTATIIHGVYNFMVTMPGFLSVIAVLIALSALVSSILTISTGRENPQSDVVPQIKTDT